MKWKNETRKVKDLIPADYNPRRLTEKQRADLTDSIKEFGRVLQVVVNGNNIIGGHQRAKIYADLGIEEIEVRVPEKKLTPKQEEKLNLRLNQNTGEWDYEKLYKLDTEMLLEVGFGDSELAGMFDDVELLDDETGGGSKKEDIEPRIALGEVWKLGKHRLMCGDSRGSENVEKLMGKDRADMIYCDPPYNIGLNYNVGMGGTKDKYGDGKRFNKDLQAKEGYRDFISMTIGSATDYAKKDCHVFYWCDENYIHLLQELYPEHGIKNQRVCLWIKNNLFPKPQIAFNKCYEPCVYGTKGKPYLNKGMINLTEVLNTDIDTGNQMQDQIHEYFNIWLADRDPTNEYQHPTQKPLSLHERPLKRCTTVGDIVLDLFGGSGSTLIACGQLGRKCRMMEVDPIFATGIINRWEETTGNKAKKI